MVYGKVQTARKTGTPIQKSKVTSKVAPAPERVEEVEDRFGDDNDKENAPVPDKAAGPSKTKGKRQKFMEPDHVDEDYQYTSTTERQVALDCGFYPLTGAQHAAKEKDDADRRLAELVMREAHRLRQEQSNAEDKLLHYPLTREEREDEAQQRILARRE